MDEFKRKYSNEDTLTVALPHFWEHFDPEGYSIWYCQYKFPDELKLTFMSCNLIAGEAHDTSLSSQFEFIVNNGAQVCSYIQVTCLLIMIHEMVPPKMCICHAHIGI